MKKNHNWTDKQIEFLKNNYPIRGKKWCAKKLKKTETMIRARASKMKLRLDTASDFYKEFQRRAAKSKIGKKRPGHSEFMKKYQKENPANKWSKESREKLSKSRKIALVKYGHPRGMLGKKKSPESIAKTVAGVKKAWKDPTRYCNSEEYKQRQSDNSIKNMQKRLQEHGSIYSRSLNGWYVISGKRFYFRSSWEVNYARYLEFLATKKEIVKWEYEPDTFWFEKIKRGVRSYLPDFKVFNNDGTFEYHEVKGYMDAKSKTKISRMALYYPDIKLIVIEKDSYKSIMRYCNLFPEAEQEPLKKHDMAKP